MQLAHAPLRTLLLAALLAPFVASEAGAADKVSLLGATVDASGRDKFAIRNSRTCRGPLTVSIALDAAERRFEATTSTGYRLQGKYKQKGKNGRKLIFKPDKPAKRELKTAMVQTTLDCAEAARARVSLRRTKLIGKVSKSLETLKLKVSIDVSGKADGERGEARYSFKASGPLVLPAER